MIHRLEKRKPQRLHPGRGINFQRLSSRLDGLSEIRRFQQIYLRKITQLKEENKRLAGKNDLLRTSLSQTNKLINEICDQQGIDLKRCRNVTHEKIKERLRLKYRDNFHCFCCNKRLQYNEIQLLFLDTNKRTKLEAGRVGCSDCHQKTLFEKDLAVYMILNRTKGLSNLVAETSERELNIIQFLCKKLIEDKVRNHHLLSDKEEELRIFLHNHSHIDIIRYQQERLLSI